MSTYPTLEAAAKAYGKGRVKGNAGGWLYVVRNGVQVSDRPIYKGWWFYGRCLMDRGRIVRVGDGYQIVEVKR